MRYRSKTKSIRGVVLRLVVGIITSLFVFGLSNAQNAEGWTSDKGQRSKAESVSCGDTITNYAVLTNNLDCSEYNGDAALTLAEGARLNLNRKTVTGNDKIKCIKIIGDGTRVWNGTVTGCDDGILVSSSDRNKIICVEVSDSKNKGIDIDDGDENLVMKCSVAGSGKQGIRINGGDSNKIFINNVYGNGRDGIEINNGDSNLVFSNRVKDNGWGTKPWYYAGIDVLSGSKNNEIKYNRAGCNLGCVGTNDETCTARYRDFWDENVDDEGKCNSTNEWENNSITCKNAVPECTPSPDWVPTP